MQGSRSSTFDFAQYSIEDNPKVQQIKKITTTLTMPNPFSGTAIIRPRPDADLPPIKKICLPEKQTILPPFIIPFNFKIACKHYDQWCEPMPPRFFGPITLNLVPSITATLTIEITTDDGRPQTLFIVNGDKRLTKHQKQLFANQVSIVEFVADFDRATYVESDRDIKRKRSPKNKVTFRYNEIVVYVWTTIALAKEQPMVLFKNAHWLCIENIK